MKETEGGEVVRIDRWLWAARFFKTRGLATEAVTGGKVHVNDSRVKPSRVIRVGDELQIRRGPHQYTVIVRGLAEQRGPTADAQALYEETEESKERRARLAEQLRTGALLQPRPKRRPSKKARREILRFTGRSW